MSEHLPTEAPVRRTLARPAAVEGASLFLGAHTSVVIHPASDRAPAVTPGSSSASCLSGIIFRRADIDGSPAPQSIPALAANITPENRRTVLSSAPHSPAPSVQTVEHLVSALAGLGITDALIEVNGPELPIGDGSAKIFTDAILAAGIHETVDMTPAPPLVVDKPIRFDDPKSGAFIEASPLAPDDPRGLHITYELDYGSDSPIKPQSASLFLPPRGQVHNYVQSIAPARTFSTRQEAEFARSMGLFKHLSPRDLLVIGPDGPIDNALRFDNECARHKLLDLLGDLALCGRFPQGIHARIRAVKTGHAHNHLLARALSAL